MSPVAASGPQHTVLVNSLGVTGLKGLCALQMIEGWLFVAHKIPSTVLSGGIERLLNEAERPGWWGPASRRASGSFEGCRAILFPHQPAGETEMPSVETQSSDMRCLPRCGP